MSFDEMILRAMLRLARRREAATEGALELRCGGSGREVRQSIRRLEAAGLVYRSGAQGSARLTLQGLAMAIARLPRRADAPEARARSWRAA